MHIILDRQLCFVLEGRKGQYFSVKYMVTPLRKDKILCMTRIKTIYDLYF